MDSSFEEILAQLRGDEDGPPENSAVSAPTNAEEPSVANDGDPISSNSAEKPLALSLTNMPVTNDMAQLFGDALLNSSHDVSDIKLQLYWMSASPPSLLRYLRTSESLVTVSLYGNPTGMIPGCRDTAEQMLEAIAENEHIQEINLAWIELSHAAIAAQRNIKELILIRSAFIIPEQDEEMLQPQTCASNLKTLIMDAWDDDSMQTLVAIGTYHPSVETLYVRYPQPFVEAQPVIDFITSQDSLKEVLVRNCGTDLSYVASIVNSLPDSSTTVEVVHGYWDTPEMRRIADTPEDHPVFRSHKQAMIADMNKTNSLIMLHCYVTNNEGKRESVFTESEQQHIKEIGSRNYMLPVLMQGCNSLWDDTTNWPALLSLGVSSEHRIHSSLVFELVRDRLMQSPARPRRQAKEAPVAVEEPSSITAYRRFLTWVQLRRSRQRFVTAGISS